MYENDVRYYGVSERLSTLFFGHLFCACPQSVGFGHQASLQANVWLARHPVRVGNGVEGSEAALTQPAGQLAPRARQGVARSSRARMLTECTLWLRRADRPMGDVRFTLLDVSLSEVRVKFQVS
jgi:hypothetical protein